jgi:hypothetical protein
MSLIPTAFQPGGPPARTPLSTLNPCVLKILIFSLISFSIANESRSHFSSLSCFDNSSNVVDILLLAISIEKVSNSGIENSCSRKRGINDSIESVFLPSAASKVIFICLLSETGNKVNPFPKEKLNSNNNTGKNISIILVLTQAIDFFNILKYQSAIPSKIISLLLDLSHVFDFLPILSCSSKSFSFSEIVASSFLFSLYVPLFFVNFIKIAEVTVSDRKREARSVINTVIGIYDKYFPITPGSVSSGINAASVVIVPEIIGGAYSRIATSIACFGEYPSCTFLLAPSITTIIVSIATQRLRISEKFVRKFKENPP